MELIPNIRFITAVLACISVPVLASAAIFQPSELAAGIIFGTAFLVGLVIILWHDARTYPVDRQQRSEKQ